MEFDMMSRGETGERICILFGEYARRSRHTDVWPLVGISPSELDGLQFFVRIGDFAGGFRNDGGNEQFLADCGICFNTYNVVRGTELINPRGFIGVERPRLDFIGLVDREVV